jgi:hypothetical protein
LLILLAVEKSINQKLVSGSGLATLSSVAQSAQGFGSTAVLDSITLVRAKEVLIHPIIQIEGSIINNYLDKKKIAKLIFFISVIMATILTFQNAAYCVPTKWGKVDSSLSDLLNSGWLLQGTDYSHVAYQNSISPGGLDEENYTFSLSKSGKYIICSVGNPRIPIAQTAGCRRIN